MPTRKPDRQPGSELRRLSGELVDATQERAYREWSAADHASRTRSTLRVAAALMGLFCFLDVGFLGVGPTSVALCAARVSWSAAALATARAAERVGLHALDRRLGGLGLGAAGVVLAAVTVRAPGFQPHTLTTAAVVVALFVLLPLRFGAAAVAALALTVGYLFVTAVGDVPLVPLLAIAAGFAVANATGAAGHAGAARVARLEFLRARAAEQAHAERLAFLAATSHELRTPLHGIVACAELLAGTPLTEEQRSLVSLIRSSGTGMSGLLEEAVRQVRGGDELPSIAPTAVDLEAFVLELGAFFRVRAATHGVEVTTRLGAGVPRFVEADAARVRQVVLNFAENALMHGARARIALSVEACAAVPGAADVTGAHEDSGWVEVSFTVTDDGPGVPPERREEILRPFVQAGPSATRARGMGLGLAISARLARAMNGRIAIDDALGGGAVFAFRVPLRVATASSSAARGDASREGSLELLLVEDEVVGRRLVSLLLERDGHSVTVATSGEEAIELTRARRFDAIVMDVRLPGMDGVEATRRIRARGEDAPPVIAMSAHVALADDGTLADIGFLAVLDKPIDLPRLRGVLARVGRTDAPARPAPVVEVHASASPPAGSAWIDEARLTPHVEALGDATVRRLMALFLETTGPLMDALGVAAEAGRVEDVATLAHRLGGAADSVALARCSEEAAAVERLARVEQRVPPEAVQRLRRAHDASSAALVAWMAR